MNWRENDWSVRCICVIMCAVRSIGDGSAQSRHSNTNFEPIFLNCRMIWDMFWLSPQFYSSIHDMVSLSGAIGLLVHYIFTFGAIAIVSCVHSTLVIVKKKKNKIRIFFLFSSQASDINWRQQSAVDNMRFTHSHLYFGSGLYQQNNCKCRFHCYWVIHGGRLAAKWRKPVTQSENSFSRENSYVRRFYVYG